MVIRPDGQLVVVAGPVCVAGESVVDEVVPVDHAGPLDPVPRGDGSIQILGVVSPQAVVERGGHGHVQLVRNGVLVCLLGNVDKYTPVAIAGGPIRVHKLLVQDGVVEVCHVAREVEHAHHGQRPPTRVVGRVCPERTISLGVPRQRFALEGDDVLGLGHVLAGTSLPHVVQNGLEGNTAGPPGDIRGPAALSDVVEAGVHGGDGCVCRKGRVEYTGLLFFTLPGPYEPVTDRNRVVN